MSAVYYRFVVGSLDGATELPDNDSITISRDGNGAYVVEPVGGASFATLGLLPIQRLEEKRAGKSTGIDGYRVQQWAAQPEGGSPSDLTFVLADLGLQGTPPGTPVPIRAPGTLAALDTVRALYPGWVVFGPDVRLRLLEAVGVATPWNVQLVIQPLTDLACCFAGDDAGGPPP